MNMLVGLATVPDGCEPVPDAEHDEWAWWPADIGRLARRGGRAAQADGSPIGQLTPVPPRPQ